MFPYFPVGAAVLARLQTDVPVVTTWHEIWKDYWMEYLGRLGPVGTVVERMTAHLYSVRTQAPELDCVRALSRVAATIRVSGSTSVTKVVRQSVSEFSLGSLSPFST